jgi:hypothetical protein
VSSPIVVAAQLGEGLLELHPLGGQATDRVVEGGRYKYRLLNVDSVLPLQPSELFEVDPDDPHTGRFRPQNHVGTVVITAGPAGARGHAFAVQVRPRKLDYEAEYHGMLEQIADHAVEAILQGFAPASRAFEVDPTQIGLVGYRALAFLVARLRSSEFQHALERIARSPHRRWDTVTSARSVQHGLPAGPHVARQLTRPGATVPLPAHLDHLALNGLPRRVAHTENVVTFDTPPNRFARYALERWQGLAFDVLRALDRKGVGAGPRARGIEECRWLIDECAGYLDRPPLRDAGPLRLFPQGDPVLRRQAGYRDVLRTFALTDAAPALVAELPDDPFAATQRNIAVLYEYWCFFKLAGCITEATGRSPGTPPFKLEGGVLALVLKQGGASRLEWTAEVAGRRLGLSLWFNRDFGPSGTVDTEYTTWVHRMRPDASLRIRPLSARPGDAVNPAPDVWLHFDAKYRITGAELDDAAGTEVRSYAEGDAKRDDMLRMHAYRDAIRRSAGAYVLYPGSGGPDHTSEYREILPGIGAFPLRPASGDSTDGSAALTSFVRDVLHHAANQASAAERMQFWSARYSTEPIRRVPPTAVLRRPPADELVLVGYVRQPQLPWVDRTRQYNVRVGDRKGAVDLADELLVARLVLLWTREASTPRLVGLFERTGPWLLRLAFELAVDGYPVRDPSSRYLVTSVNPVDIDLWPAESVAAHAPLWSRSGEPVARTWAELSAISGAVAAGDP